MTVSNGLVLFRILWYHLLPALRPHLLLPVSYRGGHTGYCTPGQDHHKTGDVWNKKEGISGLFFRFSLICGATHRPMKHIQLTLILGSAAQKKDLYRRECKGRRCFLGDRIVSLPCRASYFAPGRLEEFDFHPILHFVLSQFSLFVNSSWCKTASCWQRNSPYCLLIVSHN